MKNSWLKRVTAFGMAALMAGSFAACGSSDTSSDTGSDTSDSSEEAVSLSLWTYPIGNWGDAETVEGLIASFNEEYPNITVEVQYLDYTNGDDQVNTAIEGGNAPDIIFEGPERLVANWGAKGYMVDLSDLWTDEAKEDIYETVEAACKNSEGTYYEYPLTMTAHCMAINYDLFEAAGALQYIDEETHTWTTEDFQNAVAALVAYGQENVASVYCGGQGGDQGTRALINNLYGGTFTNEDHTAYTVDSEENLQALELLTSMDGITFDASIVGGDEINLFVNGTNAMAFCWNVGAEKANAEAMDFDAFPMAFPSDDGEAELCGGIWGFGIFDNDDDAKIEAAKTFIDFMCNDEDQVVESVKAATYWSVRESLADIYEGDEVMSEYSTFVPMMGDYYQVVGGWAEARTAWWNMLQNVGNGNDIASELATFDETANAAAAAAE